MERVCPKAFRLGGPCPADSLVGGQTPQGLQAAAEVVGADEVSEMSAELRVVVVVLALDRRVLDRAVHSLDLTAGQGEAHQSSAGYWSAIACNRSAALSGRLSGLAVIKGRSGMPVSSGGPSAGASLDGC